ncbi:MAG: thioredoxin family protein [Candidatus Accumulibacter sp. UW26]|jgi:thioredoxin 1
MSFNTDYAEIEPLRSALEVLSGASVVEFGAPWCRHCLAAQPLLESALRSHPAVRHLKVEDGPGRRLGRSFTVKLWPTLIFMRDGVEVERLVRPADAAAIVEALARIDPAAAR